MAAGAAAGRGEAAGGRGLATVRPGGCCRDGQQISLLGAVGGMSSQGSAANMLPSPGSMKAAQRSSGISSAGGGTAVKSMWSCRGQFCQIAPDQAVEERVGRFFVDAFGQRKPQAIAFTVDGHGRPGKSRSDCTACQSAVTDGQPAARRKPRHRAWPPPAGVAAGEMEPAVRRPACPWRRLPSLPGAAGCQRADDANAIEVGLMIGGLDVVDIGPFFRIRVAGEGGGVGETPGRGQLVPVPRW